MSSAAIHFLPAATYEGVHTVQSQILDSLLETRGAVLFRSLFNFKEPIQVTDPTLVKRAVTIPTDFANPVVYIKKIGESKALPDLSLSVGETFKSMASLAQCSSSEAIASRPTPIGLLQTVAAGQFVTMRTSPEDYHRWVAAITEPGMALFWPLSPLPVRDLGNEDFRPSTDDLRAHCARDPRLKVDLLPGDVVVLRQGGALFNKGREPSRILLVP